MRKVYLDTGKRSEKIVYEEYSVENNFVQTYINSDEVFFKIQSPSAFSLMMWCLIQMDKFNRISLNKFMRGEFLSSVISRGGKRYSDGTVKWAIKHLVNVNVIISFNEDSERESAYMINPAYFWKSKEQKDRLEAIKAYELRKIENERN